VKKPTSLVAPIEKKYKKEDEKKYKKEDEKKHGKKYEKDDEEKDYGYGKYSIDLTKLLALFIK